MAGVVPVSPRFQFSSTTGVPLSGGFVDVYLAGTTTRTNTWQDKAQTTLNENPIELDASGSCTIFGADDKTYKLVVKNSAGVVQPHLGGDNISCAGNTTDLAAAAAAVAQPYVDAAEAAQLAAELAQSEAEDAALDAETFAAAAATGATFYNTIALGLAGVASGATFGVIAGGSDGLTRPTIYRDDAGSATLLYAILPASEYDASFDDITPADYAWVIVDQDGKAALGVADDGTVVALNLQAETSSLGAATATSFVIDNVDWQEVQPVEMPWSVTDQDGKMALGIADDGTVYAGAVQADTLNGVSVEAIVTAASALAGFDGDGTFIADIVHIPIYGQSLSTGVNTNSVISIAQRFNNLKFSGGVRAQDAGASPAGYTSLQPLVETLLTPQEGGAGNAGETPATGMSDYIRELIASEDGILYTEQSYQMLVSCPGIGGVTLATLSKPGTYYTRLINDVTYGYSLAQAAGKTYKVPAICWLQGESDGATAVATYLAALETLRSNFNTDVQAITGQTETVQMVIYQTTTGNALLAQQQAVETYANIHMAGPHYFLAKSDGVHFTNTSSKVYGAYLGRAVKRVCIDGGDWDCVRPLSIYKQGALLYVKFNVPIGPLVFDTTIVAGQTNQGFSLVDSGGGALTISSVALAGPDTVRITASTTVAAGSKLRYAIATPLGNLRDSAGDTEIFAGNGINYAMHNWCAGFEKTIS